MSVFKRSRALLIFVAASGGAGLLNYAFQVLAARGMSAGDFAEFSAWLAAVASFFALSNWLQFAANFAPGPPRRLRAVLIATLLAVIAAVPLWFGALSSHSARGAMIVIASAAFGWTLGQAQIRLAFEAMALAGIINGLGKLGFALFLPFTALDSYRFALLAGYIPALMYLGVVLWHARPVETAAPGRWTAPLLLSLATALVPQFDLLLMNQTQPPEVFQTLAQASLFYKGIHFILFILAQWLLPHQIQSRRATETRAHVVLAALVFAVAGALTLASPLISRVVLNWNAPPPVETVFFACVHMGFLTLLALRMQEFCTLGEVRKALILLLILCLQGVGQWWFRLPQGVYLPVFASAQALVWCASLRWPNRDWNRRRPAAIP